MALEDLIARLEHDADLQVQAIAREADADVEAIAAAAAQAVAVRTAETLAERRAERQASFTRELADLRRTHRASELTAAHAALDRVFTRARLLLPELARASTWSGLWPVLMREVLSYAPGVTCRVRCASEMARTCRSLAADRAVEVVEDPSIGPGVILESLDGGVTIDATLSTRLEQQRALLALGLLDEVLRHA